MPDMSYDFKYSGIYKTVDAKFDSKYNFKQYPEKIFMYILIFNFKFLKK